MTRGLSIYSGHDEAWNRSVLAACPSLRAGFTPPLWIRSAHVQTGMFVAREGLAPALQWDATQLVTTDDGGTLSIQWLGLDAPAATPVIVVLPTITGTGDSLRRTIATLRRNTGWIVAACNRRGHAPLRLTSPRINTMGSTADLEQQLDVIQARRPGAALLGVGISAGSGLLVRYLGETGPRSRLRAAVACCPGYDISVAFRVMHPAYDRVLTKNLVRRFIHAHAPTWHGLDGVDACAASRSVAEFHDRMYPLAGYTSRDEYYARSNPMEVAQGVDVPLLVLNAADDPVCSVKNIHPELPRLQALRQLTLVLTRYGGHCGFFDAALAQDSWSDRLLAEYLLLHRPR